MAASRVESNLWNGLSDHEIFILVSNWPSLQFEGEFSLHQQPKIFPSASWIFAGIIFSKLSWSAQNAPILYSCPHDAFKVVFRSLNELAFLTLCQKIPVFPKFFTKLSWWRVPSTITERICQNCRWSVGLAGACQRQLWNSVLIAQKSHLNLFWFFPVSWFERFLN
jgi:hypothetical protein